MVVGRRASPGSPPRSRAPTPAPRVTLLERRPAARRRHLVVRARRACTFDNGQHVFLRCCTAYREFLDRIGARDRVVLQDRLDDPGRRARRRGRAASARDALPGAAAPRRGRCSATRTCRRPRPRAARPRPRCALRRLDPRDPALDERTFGAWLAAQGESPAGDRRAVGPDRLPDAERRTPTERVARARRDGVPDRPAVRRGRAADIGWAACPLAELHGEPGGARAARAPGRGGAHRRAGRRHRRAASTARSPASTSTASASPPTP